MDDPEKSDEHPIQKNGQTPEQESHPQANGGLRKYSSLSYGSVHQLGDSDGSSESDEGPSKPQCWSRLCKTICPCAPEWVTLEFPELFNLSWSMILLSLFSFLLGPISLAFCGHLGTTTLAGVALASTVVNVTGVSIGAGLATACDTFFSQSFGSVNKKMVGIYLIRGMIIILSFVFPCWAIHVNSELLLVAMGQDREVAHIAGEYILWYMPALPAVFVQDIMLQYLRCQNILMPTVVIGGIGVGLCALLHYVFLYVLDYGHTGSALAQVISFYSMAILLILYTLISKVYKKTWGGWTVEAFYDWDIFLKMALSGLLMVGLEWWSFEIGTILAGLLGAVPVSAQSIAFQIAAVAYMLPLGVGLACNIRVGQMLGGESAKRAWQVTKLGMIMIGISGLCMTAFLAATSSVLPYVFSSDSEVIEYATQVILMVAIFEFFDSVAGVCAGVMRGCGRQALGAGVILFGYYIVGLPIGISLMFLTSLEVVGLYVGLIIGLAIEACIFFIIVTKTNWQRQVEMAQVRAGTADLTEEEKRAMLHDDDYKTSPVEEAGVDEERTPFANDEGKPRKRQRTYSNIHSPYTSSSQVNLIDQHLYGNRPTKQQLFFTRFMFILGMVLVFAAGLCVRFFVPIPEATSTNWTQLCLPMNATNSTQWNTTLPFCNYTMTVINATAASDFFNVV